MMIFTFAEVSDVTTLLCSAFGYGKVTVNNQYR